MEFIDKLSMENNKVKENIQKIFKNWNEINQNRISIEKGVVNSLELKLICEDEVKYPILKGTEEDIKMDIQANLQLEAPIQENTTVGKLIITYQEKIIKEIEIVNTNSVDKKGIQNYLAEFISNYCHYFENVLDKL